jgi:hypothetical protein
MPTKIRTQRKRLVFHAGLSRTCFSPSASPWPVLYVVVKYFVVQLSDPVSSTFLVCVLAMWNHWWAGSSGIKVFPNMRG